MCKGREPTQNLFQPENQKSSDGRMVRGCDPWRGLEERERTGSTGGVEPSAQDTAETFGDHCPTRPGWGLDTRQCQELDFRLLTELGTLRRFKWLFTSGYGDTAPYHGTARNTDTHQQTG